MELPTDNTERWFAAAGGIGFGVLTILGWAFWAAPDFPKLSPGIPSLSDSPASVASFVCASAAFAVPNVSETAFPTWSAS